MTTLRIMADAVSPDEPCYGLREGPVTKTMPNGGHKQRWIQRVWVVRGDALACFEVDYGPAVHFKHVQELIMPSYGENSVAQLQECADDNRMDDYWHRRMCEIRESSALIADAVEQTQQRHELVANRSQFGPNGHFQRDGFSLPTVERYIQQRRRDYYGKVQL